MPFVVGIVASRSFRVFFVTVSPEEPSFRLLVLLLASLVRACQMHSSFFFDRLMNRFVRIGIIEQRLWCILLNRISLGRFCSRVVLSLIFDRVKALHAAIYRRLV
jgi:hypothetical protein